VEVRQPSPYSASSRPASHLAEELGQLAAELSPDALEVVVIVARRLARAEERTR
jgi:hypothetical protein